MTKEETNKFYDSLAEKEIRRRQDLCQQQIKIAYDTKNDRGMDKLRIMEEDLMQAMLRRC